MNATLPASTTIPAPSGPDRRNIHLPAWTRHLHLASTGLLIAVVIALSIVAYGPNGIGTGNDGTGSNGTGDGPSLNGAVPIATVTESVDTSSIPYPSPDECTIETTREELIADIQAANVATAPDYQQYQQAIEPSHEDAQAIMQTFREWQACGTAARQIQLQTPWFTANSLPIFSSYAEARSVRPISEQEIEAYADVLLNDDPADDANATLVPDTGTPPPMPNEAPADQLPVPGDATPILFGGGWSHPTIFAEDIILTGPDTAKARAYMVDEQTGEIQPSNPQTYGFVRVDGKWLIDSYSEGSRG